MMLVGLDLKQNQLPGGDGERKKKKEDYKPSFKSLKSKRGVCVGLEFLVAKIDEKNQYNASESSSIAV